MELTATEAAEVLGVTDRTIRYYIEKGMLPAKRRGLRNFAISLSDLQKFANDQNMVFDERLAERLAH